MHLVDRFLVAKILAPHRKLSAWHPAPGHFQRRRACDDVWDGDVGGRRGQDGRFRYRDWRGNCASRHRLVAAPYFLLPRLRQLRQPLLAGIPRRRALAQDVQKQHQRILSRVVVALIQIFDGVRHPLRLASRLRQPTAPRRQPPVHENGSQRAVRGKRTAVGQRAA